MTDKNFTYEEAKNMFGIDDDFTVAEVRTAYRVKSNQGDVDQDTMDAAFATISDYIKNGEEIEENTTHYNFNNTHDGPNITLEELEYAADPEGCERRAKLNAKLPAAAPADYRHIREIAQHFPYRIAFLALMALVCVWHFQTMSLWSCLIFIAAVLIGIANTFLPFITNPLRYKIIQTIDDVFEKRYMKEQNETTDIVENADNS